MKHNRQWSFKIKKASTLTSSPELNDLSSFVSPIHHIPITLPFFNSCNYYMTDVCITAYTIANFLA